MKTKHTATLFAILAAALYAINIPLSKILLVRVEPTMMAAFLYLGAGLGLFLYGLVSREKEKGDPLTKAELPYTIGMIVLDIAAPILLMLGLEKTNSANASLLNNFEIVATSMIAFFVFREALSRRLSLAIVLVTAASIALSFEGEGSFRFSIGSFLVLGVAFGILLLNERPGIQFYTKTALKRLKWCIQGGFCARKAEFPGGRFCQFSSGGGF